MPAESRVHEDRFESLLDRVGILREELISVERSLERMKAERENDTTSPKTPPTKS
jgi:hypothetical protein